MIAKIKQVIEDLGSTSTFELELQSSPCINSIGNGKNNVCQLAEHFKHDGIDAVIYHDDTELGEDFIPYEDLKKNVIEEIYEIILTYEKEKEER